MRDRDAEKLTVITTYATAGEARLDRNRLEQAGIRACVEGDVTGTMLWYVGTALGGIKLLVAASDLERACRVLGHDAEAAPGPGAAWPCPECGTVVEPGFAVCWSCGHAYDSQEIPAAPISETADPDDEAATCSMCGRRLAPRHHECPDCGEPSPAPDSRRAAEAPQESVEEFPAEGVANPSTPDDDAAPDVPTAAEYLQRAWRTAMFGTVMFPPLLSIYSAMQLAHYHRLRVENDLPKHWRAAATFWINALMISAWALFWLSLGVY